MIEIFLINEWGKKITFRVTSEQWMKIKESGNAWKLQRAQ